MLSRLLEWTSYRRNNFKAVSPNSGETYMIRADAFRWVVFTAILEMRVAASGTILARHRGAGATMGRSTYMQGDSCETLRRALDLMDRNITSR